MRLYSGPKAAARCRRLCRVMCYSSKSRLRRDSIICVDGTATHLNPSGPEVRTDYAWSPDGSRFCFSSPGEPGSSTAGIYIATRENPTSFTRLWDRGEHPRFIPGNEFILCSGPAGTIEAGIWQLSLAGSAPELVIPAAFAPEVSPNGLRIAYLLPIATLNNQLVVLDRETAARDTLTNNVLNFSWLGDSQTLVFESDSSGSQLIGYIRLELGATPIEVGFGTRPAGFPGSSDFVYTGLVADRLAGLRIAAPGRPPTRITIGGTWAIPASATRIVAQDGAALVEVTR